MKYPKFLFAILILSFLAGCATVSKPETPNQTLAYVAATIDSLAVSILNNASKLDENQKEKAKLALEDARMAINESMAAIGLYEKLKDPKYGDMSLSELEKAQQLIQVLQDILAEVADE